MTTPSQSDWFGLNSQRMMNYAQISASQTTNLVAGEYVAIWAYHEATTPIQFNIAALSIVRTGAGPPGPAGGTAAKTFRTSHTWAVAGALTASTLPPMFIPKTAGQTTTVAGIIARSVVAPVLASNSSAVRPRPTSALSLLLPLLPPGRPSAHRRLLMVSHYGPCSAPWSERRLTSLCQ